MTKNGTRPKRQKIMLVCNARDEKHIREWVAHHLLLGFKWIVIFDHKSIEPIKDVLKGFPPNVYVIPTKLSNRVKITLMNQASNLAKQENADWMIYLDADEYIVLHPTIKSINHLLFYYRHAHSLGINWLMFGSNNLIKDPDDLMLNSYTKSETIVDKHVKSFVRPSEIIGCDNPHYYHIRDKAKYYGSNNSKVLKTPYFNEVNKPFNQVACFIAHYCYQSEETYRLRKCMLPADDTGVVRQVKTDNLSYIHNSHNQIDNLVPSKMYGKKVKEYLNKINYDY
jgi:hypothetical protein